MPSLRYVGLSAWHGASFACRWRIQPPDMKGSCEYIERAVIDSQQGAVLSLLQNATQGLGFGWIL